MCSVVMKYQIITLKSVIFAQILNNNGAEERDGGEKEAEWRVGRI